MLKTLIESLLRPATPQGLVRRWRGVNAAGRKKIEHALRAHYFSQAINHMGLGEKGYLATDEGRLDLANHLEGRLCNDRREVIPWLESLIRLSESRILEIGCGTGSSTVALAEQAAVVTGLDVNSRNVEVARERCSAYGLYPEFIVGNATEIGDWATPSGYELVIFFATLEHLTISERLAALRAAWACVTPGGLMVIFEAPNRLWWFDGHTARLPFFHWLPDELAVPVSRESPRPWMRELYGGVDFPSPEKMLDFARRGRGVSYHEIMIALGREATLAVRGDLLSWRRSNLPLAKLKWRLSRNGRYQRLLRAFAGGIPSAYFERDLSLALEKAHEN